MFILKFMNNTVQLLPRVLGYESPFDCILSFIALGS